MKWLDAVIMFFLKNKLIVTLFVTGMLFWGIMVAPFDWNLGGLERSPVPVDAIPDIGENQQIVFTKWMGRSPQDIEDQITYPLTTSLLGIPGVKTIRSNSMFGFSSIYEVSSTDCLINEILGKLPEDCRSFCNMMIAFDYLTLLYPVLFPCVSL